MTIEVTRVTEHEDGSATGLLYWFNVHHTYGVAEVEVRLRLVARLSRASKRHKLKWGDKWDFHDERAYNSSIKRKDLPDLVPEDVRAEALSKVTLKVVIPEPTESKP